MLALCDVHRHFPGNVKALDGVDLEIAEGEFVAIMGPSGSGKSTLLNIVGLLDVPTAGSYLFDGDDVAALGERARTAFRAANLGFVFQQFHLLPQRTARENVEFGMTQQGVGVAQRRERAAEALIAVGLKDRLDAVGRNLSGGEQQRVALARALARQPRLLLCDEPTGALDSHTGAEILGLLRAAGGHGITVVMVTHDDDAAGRADRIVRLRDGRVVP